MINVDTKIGLIIGNIRFKLNTKQFVSNIVPRKMKFIPNLVLRY